MEQHLSKKTTPNRRNGYGNKTVKSSVRSFELETPRDREGSFESQIVKKNQTKLTDELDQKILSMFASHMSYKDIRSHVEEIYAVDVPEATIHVADENALGFRAKKKDLIRGKMLQECKCISKRFNDEVDFFNSPQRARLLSFYPSLVFLDLVATYLQNTALVKNL